MSTMIRVIYSVSSPTLGDRVDELKTLSQTMRGEEGCVEFDMLRSVQFPENFVQLELWESAAAFDANWKRRGVDGVFCDIKELCAPSHLGRAQYPRRHGPNGAEFYRHREYQLDDRRYVPKDPADRTDHLRWPSRSAVRICIGLNVDPANDHTLLPYSVDTRNHPGCLQFDWFRSLSFPENLLHLELWEAPASVYDGHYFRRALQEIWGDVGVDRPVMAPVGRRYGRAGFEFYEHCFFELIGDSWEPEDAALRLTSVRWA